MRAPNLTFPAPGMQPRETLSSGRWQTYMFIITGVWVGSGALELPVAGRRVVVAPPNLNPLATVFNPVAGAQENQTYSPADDARIVLWFDRVGAENLVTPVNPLHAHWRLEGSGIYVPNTAGLSYEVTFHRLFLEVMNYNLASVGTELIVSIESWNEKEGDRS